MNTYLAQAFRAALGQLGETTFSYVRACMIVPLSLKDQMIGMLVLTSSNEEAFTTTSRSTRISNCQPGSRGDRKRSSL